MTPSNAPAPDGPARPAPLAAAGPPPLAELANFARLHARAQGLDEPTVATVLRRILTDGTDAAWPRVWAAHGDRLLRAGRPLEACRAYTLARFPYPADPERRAAGAAAVRAFDRWRRRTGGIRRLELDLPGGRAAAWAAGPEPREHRPLLLVIGGIISVKEQWAPFLRAARRLGVAVVVTEMPAVGENTGTYGPHSTELIPELLDALGAHACAAGVEVVALSFAGHLALAAAAHDPRITGVHTVGAPVAGVFADPETWRNLPATTRATLAHLTGEDGSSAGEDGAAGDGPDAAVRKRLAPMALRPDDLAAVRVPVRYVASRRDEIIPRREWERLAVALPDFTWVEFDDVHGSPAHLTDTRLWLLRGVLARLGDRRARLLGAALALRGNCERTGRTRLTAGTGRAAGEFAR